MPFSQRFCPTHLIDQDFARCISPHDFIMPLDEIYNTNYYRPWRWCLRRAIKDVGSTIFNRRDRFEIQLDVQQFRPNEVSVKVTDKEIIIDGNHEEREDEHGYVARQFTRRYVLPNDCPTDKITSTLSSDGVLIVTALKMPKEYVNQKGKIVPIAVYGTYPRQERMEYKSVTKIAQKGTSDLKSEDEEKINKNKSQNILKEEHSCLLKPEFFKEAVLDSTEKLGTDTKKEIDETWKTSSEKLCDSKAKEIHLQSKSDLEKYLNQPNVTSASEISSFKSVKHEKMESYKSSSSYKSSMESIIKPVNEFASETTSTQLKEVAENVSN